jgi:flagellar basal-body rod modification protein FlgD
MDLTGILAAANPSSAAAGADKTKFGQDYNQFLRLLTTQLQNQDPLSPMDTAQFTNQLVQFSSVEQQIKTNDYMQKILALNSLNLNSMALNYVGLNVYSTGSDFVFDGANPEQMSYDMPEGAAVAKISIVDADGNTVFSQDADTTPGNHTLKWDGKNNDGQLMEAGTYKILIGAQDKDKKALSVKTYVSGLVEGVVSDESGMANVIVNGKKIPVTDVKQATLPTYAYAPQPGDTTDTGGNADDAGNG